MKKLILLFFCILLTNITFAQPGNDWLKNIKNSFSINADIIRTKDNISLSVEKYIYIDEYMCPQSIILSNENSKGDSFFYIGVFGNEFDNTNIYQYKFFNFFYNDQIMVLKVKKNRRYFDITINNFFFQEGIFEIDLEDIYQKYGKEDSPNQVQISKFPLEK